MRLLITSIVDIKKSAHLPIHEYIGRLAANHQITALCINDWWKIDQARVDPTLYGVDHLEDKVNIHYLTHRRTSPALQEIFSPITCRRLLPRNERPAFDVHLSYTSLLSGYYVARRLIANSIPTVYVVADDVPEMLAMSPQIPSPLRPLARYLGSLVIKRNIALARHVTYITKALKETYHIPESKSQLLPNGVDTDLFKEMPDIEIRRKIGLNDSFVLGYVGVLREWVDLEPIYSAMTQLLPQLSDLRLMIVGQEGKLEQNRALVRKYGLQEKVIFAGTVPYPQVPQYVSAMDVCLIPFRDNAVSSGASPMKLFEYMACKRPVVSTDLAGVKEAVADRILYASSPQDYLQIIPLLYKQPRLRRHMGEEGRIFVEMHYSWASVVSQLEQILEEAKAA